MYDIAYNFLLKSKVNYLNHVNFVNNDIKIEEKFTLGDGSKISKDRMTKFHKVGDRGGSRK